MARIKTDWILFLVTVLMVAFGLVIVYSASSVVGDLRFRNGNQIFLKQAGFTIVSFATLMMVRRKNYRTLESPTWAFVSLGIVLIMLVAVYFVDARQHRWFRLGPASMQVSIQPSEFAKPALIIFLAWFITQRAGAINHKRTLILAAMALAIVAGTVASPDLGTAVVLVATAAAVFYVAGLGRRYIAMAAVGVMLLGAALVVAKPYRLGRIIAFVDPAYDKLSLIDRHGWVKNYVESGTVTRDQGYQARQSKIAVGSGGMFGLGLMQGVMKLLYLPEAHTDFIYAVVGEELGLLGTTAVLAGFLVILWRGLRLFWLVPDDFGKYLALGVTVSIVVQAMINMSVVLDIGPTKGIPLPMISYGGSSLLSSLVSLGMLLNVSDHAG